MPDPVVPFGRPMRDAHFMIAPEYTPLNHGAFGTYPRSVRDDFRKWQDLSEARPDSWVRYEYPNHLDSATAAIASFLGVPADDVALVPNATTGINTVLRSLRFDDGDLILHFSTVYGACAKTVDYLKETTPLQSASIELEYPIDDIDIVKRFNAAVEKLRKDGKRIRIALFDTISSMPGVQVPWQRLVDECKAFGILSLIDGAHGVGHAQLDLAKHQPDFFVSNLHKWLFVPRGCALFYVPKRNQHLIRSALPTSHGFVPKPVEGGQPRFDPLADSKRRDTPFQKLLRFVATADNSPYLCIGAALKFRDDICGGEDSIRAYNTRLAVEGGKRIAEILGTETMEDAGNLHRCFFANVRLPIAIGDGRAEVRKKDVLRVVEWIVEKLVDDFDMYLGVFVHAGKIWTRLSGQIYIDMQDVVQGGLALQKICERVQAGEYLQQGQ